MAGHEDRKHARFSPSQAERFFACKGSTNFLATVPRRPPSIYAIEGTTAHTVLEAGLRAGVRTAKEAHEESVYWAEDLDKDENLFYFSIQVALNYVYAILDEYTDAVMVLESEVNVPCEAAPNEADGYCDIYIYVPSIQHLFVIDYKHGAGVTKGVEGNKQCLQYAAGLVWGNKVAEDVQSVTLAILQPRAYHQDGATRECEVTPYELFEYLDEMDTAIAANLDPRATLRPDDNGKTTDHCRFCDAKTVCPAREALAASAVSTAVQTVTEIRASDLPPVSTLSIERLAYIRLHAPMLRKFLDDCDDHLFELARQGHTVPGAKMVETLARRKYYGDPNELVHKLSALADVPVDQLIEWKLLPITQMEKLVVEAFKARVGRGKKNLASADAKKAFAYFTLKDTSGNLTLVDDSDPRPAVSRATDSFAQIGAVLSNIG